jgi:hypothetical protein
LVRRRCPIARRLDGADEVGELDAARVVADRRLLGRVVDVRVDPVELVQLALDPRRARGAGHSLEDELDAFVGVACRRGGGHAAS